MADGWVTLRGAHEQSGASISALRKWYKEGAIQSREEKGRYGTQRMVQLDEVLAKVRTFRPEPAVHEPGMVSLPAEAVAEALQALSQAVTIIAKQADELVAAERAQRATERVLEKLAGSGYAAATLVEAERQ